MPPEGTGVESVQRVSAARFADAAGRALPVGYLLSLKQVMGTLMACAHATGPRGKAESASLSTGTSTAGYLGGCLWDKR